MQFPLVGDRLGRESVTGAKKLRSGCDEAKERFDNIVEVVRILACQTKFVEGKTFSKFSVRQYALWNNYTDIIYCNSFPFLNLTILHC